MTKAACDIRVYQNGIEMVCKAKPECNDLAIMRRLTYRGNIDG